MILVLNLIFFMLLKTGLADEAPTPAQIDQFMSELKKANRGWNTSIYELKDWKAWGWSVEKRPLVYWTCGDNKENTTLILSTIHGDEITPVYFGLRAVSYVSQEPDLCKKFRVVVAPIVNPDGYLKKVPTRTNKNGVDVNRNFPTKDFDAEAVALWKSKFKSDPRRFPGNTAGSEPETKFQQWLIDEFKPRKILSVHSPYNFYDYDGPSTLDVKNFKEDYIKACTELRSLIRKKTGDYKFIQYGYFPGSLGNYAGRERAIPTLTLELPSENAQKAKAYFEKFKTGTRSLIEYQLPSSPEVSIVKSE